MESFSRVGACAFCVFSPALVGITRNSFSGRGAYTKLTYTYTAQLFHRASDRPTLTHGDKPFPNKERDMFGDARVHVPRGQ